MSEEVAGSVHASFLTTFALIRQLMYSIHAGLLLHHLGQCSRHGVLYELRRGVGRVGAGA
ncbi:MAG TPA: hypothetical protein VMU65_11120 [Candidatus Saccharimonadales bacterium]|nr:hypothetical protein [Candidatus Saccharimonadales bacterium]